MYFLTGPMWTGDPCLPQCLHQETDGIHCENLLKVTLSFFRPYSVLLGVLPMLPCPSCNPAPPQTSCGNDCLFPSSSSHLEVTKMSLEVTHFVCFSWSLWIDDWWKVCSTFSFHKVIYSYILSLNPPSSPSFLYKHFTALPTITGTRSTTGWDRNIVSLQFSLLVSAGAQEAFCRLGKGEWCIWLNPCSV